MSSDVEGGQIRKCVLLLAESLRWWQRLDVLLDICHVRVSHLYSISLYRLSLRRSLGPRRDIFVH